MKNQNVERLIEFNDNWGKRVVKEYLINAGINEADIFDTKKYDCVDLIISYHNSIQIIEIKNRYTPPKLYNHLPAFGLQDVKYEAMMNKKKELEKYHQKPVIMYYANLAKDELVCHNLNKIDITQLEVQERYTQRKNGSEIKDLHKYYQLPYSTGKINNIPKHFIDERNDFFSRSTWE